MAATPRVPTLAFPLLLAAIALAGGCARHTGADRAPAACTSGSAQERMRDLRGALTHAPGPVALRGGTRISSCIAHVSDTADLQNVGATLLSATQNLADSARGRRPGRALTQLGYLIGAVQRGASQARGLDDDLLRRLEQELSGVDTQAPPYRLAERAGRATG